MSHVKSILGRLRLHYLQGSAAMVDLQLDGFARQLARKSLTADERWLINVEMDMLYTEWRTLKLMIALLERKRRVSAGLPPFPPV